MREGDVILAALPQTDGTVKRRPAVILREMPPFNHYLVCGVSSQLQHEVAGFDEMIAQLDPDYITSGLRSASLIRLGFLSLVPRQTVLGSIGFVAPERHGRSLRTLAEYIGRNTAPS